MTLVRPPDDDDVRPASLDDVIGQGEVVSALRVALAGAASRGELPGHILLAGPAGTGKTTLALCVAAAIGGRLVQFIGPSLKTPGHIMPNLITARERDVFFIDEIHRVWQPAQEFLFPVMEDGSMTVGNSGRSVKLANVLFIGATTDPERLLTPMLDRFVIPLRLRQYRPDELAAIATRAAGKLGCSLMPEAADIIAASAEGIPRVAIRLVRASRDYAYAEPQTITIETNLNLAADGKVTQVGKGVGRVTITEQAVRTVLASTAYVWRTEGRSAGG